MQDSVEGQPAAASPDQLKHQWKVRALRRRQTAASRARQLALEAVLLEARCGNMARALELCEEAVKVNSYRSFAAVRLYKDPGKTVVSPTAAMRVPPPERS